MASEREQDFPPFVTYDATSDQIDTFVRFTEYSYALSWHLMELNPPDSLPERSAPTVDELKRGSYTPADTQIRGVELVCEWVTYDEYAEREKADSAMIAEAAARGDFGVVKQRADTQESVIIWPPDLQQDAKAQALEPNKKSFRVTADQSVHFARDLELGEHDNASEMQAALLALAHQYGPDEASRRQALKTLFSSGLLLQWTAFEEFLRDTVAYLLRKHPTKISDSKKSVSYEELINLTEEFGSIKALQDALIQREIDRLRGGGQSVHGLINFLKREFCFEKDPYVVRYIFAGQRVDAGYTELLELKDLRNVIAHNGAANSPIADDEDFETIGGSPV